MKLNRFILLLAAWLPALAWPAGSVLAGPGDGTRALNNYLARHRTRVTFCAMRIEDGAVFSSRDAQTPVLPASVQKLATSAVALEVLGDGFAFTTGLAIIGDDLVVIGDCDPATGDPVLADQRKGSIYDLPDAWAKALKAAGVTTIRGDLLLDDAAFDAGRHPDWPKKQKDRWYCAPVGGLNFNDNCIDVTFIRSGSTITPTVLPQTRYMPVVNQLRASSSKHVWGAYFAANDASVTLRGDIKQSMTSPLSVAVNEPAMLFGRVLADRLNRAGIELKGQIVRRQVVGAGRKLPPGGRLIAVHRTPITDVLVRANKRSLNMMAECLLLRSAATKTFPATFDAGAKLATDVLTKTYGLDARQFRIADGSGMSRGNRFSAEAMASLLRAVARGKHAKTFGESLAVPGQDGTFAKRLTHLAGRVACKSGSLSGVSSIAGYILDAQGRPVAAFAIFCNNVQGGNALAKDVQNALVTEWVGMLDR